MAKVNVYEDGKVIARVKYNNNLDFWNGSNWTCGSTGRHLGLTRLRKSGQYVLIHVTQWQGEQDRAEIITEEEAYRAIVSSGHTELLEKFPDLRRFEEDLDTDEDLDESKTTIQISKALQKQLTDLKQSPDETYQAVLERLVKRYKYSEEPDNSNVNYELLKMKGGKAVELGKGKTFDPAEEFSKLSDSEKSEFTNIMIEVIEKKIRQGQKKAENEIGE